MGSFVPAAKPGSQRSLFGWWETAEFHRHRKSLIWAGAHDDTLYTPLEGFGTSSEDYNIQLENHETCAGVVITGDQPLRSWAVRAVLAAPEPYIRRKISPGEERSWKLRVRLLRSIGVIDQEMNGVGGSIWIMQSIR